VAGVDKGIELAELELEDSPDTLPAHYLADLADDAESVLDTALVVIGQVEDEQVAEIEVLVHAGSFLNVIHAASLKRAIPVQAAFSAAAQ
jgi:hypothetical protein